MNYLKRRGFDSVEMDGKVVYRPTVRQLGEPPWEIEMDDPFEGIIPEEATDMVGAVSWRGIRFTRENNGWMATSLSYTTDYDTTHLKDVYVNGIRFTRKD